MMLAQVPSIAPGWLQSPDKKLKKGYLTDCISVAAIEDGFIINKDGSIAVGLALTLFEEETLDEDSFMKVIHEFSAACRRLPTGTVIQKLDIYDETSFTTPIPTDSPFFHRKTLEHHDNKQVLQHQCFIFLRFFVVALNPVNTFLALGSKLFKTPFVNLAKGRAVAMSACQEFIAAMPAGLKLSQLDDAAHTRLLYQYTSLTFHRAPIGFERSLTVLPDSIAMGVHLKSVKMTAQAEEVTGFKKNNWGHPGVTSPFTWRLTHFAAFPHILCQRIELIQDAKFRKAKSLELAYSAQLKLGVRGRELAEHVQASLLALEKALNQQDAQLVQLSYNVLVWHADQEVLQRRVDHIKSAFGKTGIESAEEAADTAPTFLASIPGASGFLEGFYMPIETAVAYCNFVTPKKGDKQGILLSNRHGHPIYYDPYKYSLDNQHAFVFGPSGSGKSFFNGKMIKDRYYAGHTLVVIDSGGTYRFLFQALGGKYIEYKPAKPLQLNPFLVKKKAGQYKPDPDKIAFLINFLAKMWKGDLHKNPLSEVAYALLAKFLTRYYQTLSGSDVPTLVSFCAWLKAYVAEEAIEADLFDIRNFLIVLEPFTAGIYKDHFNATEVVHLEDSKLLCFELEAIKSDSKLYPLVVKVLFDYVLQLVAAQPAQQKFIDIEEGWSMLDDSSQDYIAAFFRKGRKTNTAIRIITQHVDEIRASAIAGAMKNNASTFILLYNDKESVRQDIAEFLGMNAFDMEKYASLRRKDHYLGGYREVFIKEMDQSSVWRIGISLFEHGMLTSRPDERNELNGLIQEQGSIQSAVMTWAQRIHELHSDLSRGSSFDVFGHF